MGKRAKKKVQSSPGKLVAGSRIASFSPASASSPLEIAKVGEKGNSLIEKGCSHGSNLDKLRVQLAKSSAIHCLECAKLRSGPVGGKDRRVKGKPLKKRSHSQSAVSLLPEEKVSTHKLWICLSCGHVGCGTGKSSPYGTNGSEKLVAKQGVVGRGHAWQHWLQLKHPMVMHCGDEFVCWCFQCEAAHEHKPMELETTESSELETQTGSASEVETQKSSEWEAEESLEVEIQKLSKDEVDASVPPSRAELLRQCAKLVQKKLMEQVAEIKGQSPNGPDQEDGKSNNVAGAGDGVMEEEEGVKPKRIIKGLMNLGNTCFFNSVMQNLLGVEVLRNHFLGESATIEGPLTTSLRKFFQEITVQPPGETLGLNDIEGGLKRGVKARGGWSGLDGVHNPKGLFGAVCAKVPRFKGYQQQDSHELLKCLLDGLHTEEETARKPYTTASKKADDRDNDVVVNGDDTEHCIVSGKKENGMDGLEKKKQAPAETFVEKVFGGQLSSTVSCCECGHSSVVYEPFLDLSLSIPVRKTSPRPTPLQSVSEQSTNRLLSNMSKNQRIQSFKSKGSQLTVKTSDRNDLDDDVLNSSSSHIAGLGAPILLLPPPPPRDSNVENRMISTGSDDTSWLEFLDDPEDLGSQVMYGCSPNLGGYASGSGLSHEGYVSSSAINQDFQMGQGCVSNGNSIKQGGISNGDIASLHALNAHRFEEIDDESRIDGSLDTTVSSADHSWDIQPCEKLLLLEAPRQSWTEARIHSSWFDSERSNFESGDLPEEDGYIQIRGGSESQVLLLTQGNETDFLAPEPIAEYSSYPGTSAEQSGNCGDDSNVHSENMIGPNVTPFTLDSAQDGEVSTNLDGQGDYDGVASLFEEEESTEYAPSYGPFPLNHGVSGYEGSSGFEEVALDDVLDLGKINFEGRDDWLVCTNDRQEEDSEEVTISLEGCLQIFTRPETLSGENAWGCENCTNKYYEKLAASLVKSSVTLPPKDSPARIPERDRLENGSPLSDLIDLDTLGGEEPPNSSRLEEGLSDTVCKDVATDQACSSSILQKGFSRNGSGSGGVVAKVYPLEDVKSDGPSSSIPATSMPAISCSNGNSIPPPGVDEQGIGAVKDDGLVKREEVNTRQENGDLLFVRSTAELADLPSSSSSNGSIKSVEKEKARDVSGSQNNNPKDDVQGDECDTERQEAEFGTGEAEKMTSSSTSGIFESEKITSSSSGRTVKLTKSRRVIAEPRKVIKQEATKRYLISKAPPVLVVQLKRFARDMRGRLSKLYGPVAFQEWLDLSPYVDHRHVTPQNCRYRLTGTVEHTGTLKGGHYVAYVRGPTTHIAAGLKHDATGNPSQESSWYHISDSYVRQTSLDAVLKSEAYLLFYEKC